MRSRGTPRLPVVGKKVAGSSLHQLPPSGCVVRMPCERKSKRRELGVFRLREWTRGASPFPPLKMTE